MANQVKLRSFCMTSKYMYGIDIPKDQRHQHRKDTSVSGFTLYSPSNMTGGASDKYPTGLSVARLVS
jgi:hypothetical protein